MQPLRPQPNLPLRIGIFVGLVVLIIISPGVTTTTTTRVRAIQFVRHMAKEWQIDPNRIAATGGSAGAGISAWIAFHDEMANPESVHQRRCRVEKVREFAS